MSEQQQESQGQRRIFGFGSGSKGPAAERFHGTVIEINTPREGEQSVLIERDNGKRFTLKLAEGDNFGNRLTLAQTIRKGHVEPGGVLLVEGAKLKGDTYEARWVRTALPNAEAGQAIEGQMSVSPLKISANGNEYRTLSILQQGDTIPVKSAEALDAALIEATAKHGRAVVRAGIKDGGELVTDAVNVYSDTRLPEEERIAKLRESKGYKQVMRVAEGDAFPDVVEVTPVRQVLFGGDSASAKGLDNFVAHEERNGKEISYSKGYFTGLAAIYQMEDGTEFATSALISKTYNPDFRKGGPLVTGGAGAPTVESRPASPEDYDDDLDNVDLAQLAQQAEAGSPAPRVAGMGMR